MMRKSRRMRSKSPFRRSRSKSPGQHPGREKPPSRFRSMSPFPRRKPGKERRGKQELDESEINIFQKLCLDRHDENAAIEILLDGPEDEVPGLMTASPSSSNASPVGETKRAPFLKRLFQSPRKKHFTPLPKTPPIPRGLFPAANSNSSDPSGDSPNSLPKPPSAVPQNRDMSTTIKQANINAVSQKNRNLKEANEVDDSFSSMSSLSGTRASTQYSHLRKPMTLNRHESLGMNSIKDVRKSLKEMERQLGKASHKGERVSRQKVMKALFTVADSLEDMEEREVLRAELQKLMNKERHHQQYHEASDRQLPYSIEEENDENDPRVLGKDYPAGKDSRPPKTTEHKETSPFNLFATMSKMFNASTEEKEAAEQALDDLLWTEFVEVRKNREEVRSSSRPESARRSSKSNRGASGRQPLVEPSPVKITVHQKPAPVLPRQSEPSRPAPRVRSWWRRQSVIVEESESSSSSSYSSSYSSRSSWDDEEDIEEDDYEEDESTDSEDNLRYLPNSITVRQPRGRPVSSARRERSFNGGSSLYNSRYKVQMVDTESRFGFEMGSVTSSRK